MIKNTSPAASSSTLSRVVTNDLYLAAYLFCEGCMLERVYRNERSRVSFVLVGKAAKEMKRSFIMGKVFLNVGSFRRSLNFMRDLAHPDERSPSCPKPSLPPVPA